MKKQEYPYSCLEKYKETSKLIDGYSQLNSMPRALGFENGYEINCAIHKYRHLFNASDIQNVAKWFFENGYDIIKLKK
jgi:hypothetical protein